MSIIEEIYHGQYQPQAGRPNYPRNLQAEDIAFWDKVTEVMGSDFVDAHLYRLSKKADLTDLYHFREGFKLGVRLMLEAVAPQ